MSSATRPRLLLIDGHSMAFRAFFALPVENFATAGGTPTNAVYGFVSMLTNLLAGEEPTHIAVAFDAGSHTFRTEVLPTYKGTRDATPPEFQGQVPLIQEVLAALRIPSIEKDNYEADDILATLASQGAAAGMDVRVVSGDRDTFQLVTDDVTVLYPVKGVSELARMTPQAVLDKYGVGPAQYPELAALVGETSDNLPGIPGVGPKTAAKWIGAYGGFEQILARADEVPGKAGENLRTHLDQVKVNRQLNALLTDLELPVGPTDLEAREWDREAIHEIFDALEFRTLRERLLALMPSDGPVEHGTTVGVDEVAAGGLQGWLAGRAEQVLGLDVRGRPAPAGPDAWGVAVADSAARAVVYDLEGISPDDDGAFAAWAGDAAAGKVVHGAKDAWHSLSGRGVELAGVEFDTELAAYLCRPDRRGYDLADVVQTYLQREIGAAEAASGQGALDLDGGSEELVAAERAAATVELAEVLRGELADRSATHLLTDLELPLSWVLARMEKAGIAADVEYLAALEKQFDGQVTTAAQAAYDAIGHEVNLGSPKQLQEVLFGELDMPKTKRTKTGYTTDAAALADLFAKTQHPFLEHLLAHREAIRLRQTVEGLIRSVADDGRIHTSFRQTIAATGRLSSIDPNLQNIPIRTAEGRLVRRAFVVGDGYETLLTADYSQVEMRIMAHLSGDEALIEAFRAGEDLHRYVGSRVWEIDPAEVTPEMRSKIKAMSFGLAYGLSAFGLSKQLDIDLAEAQRLMDDYFARFGAVRDYLHRVVEEARQTGYTETILGRRRYLPDLTSDNRQRREIAERVALNAPIQGSAADIIKIAMIAIDREVVDRGLSSRMLLQVHDELVIEVAPGEREEVEALVREQMGAAVELSLPLDVSVGVGKNWHDAGH